MSNPDVDFSGMLTRDNWLQWYKMQATEENEDLSDDSQRSIELVIEYRADRCFEYISESLVFREKFFMLPKMIQKEVGRYVRDENPIEHIEEFVTLAVRLDAQQNMTKFANRSDRVDTYLRPLITSVSDDFDNALFDFRICYPNTSRSLCHGIVLALASLYDASLVESILQQWTRGECPGHPSDFADVVEYFSSNDGEDLTKYPIEWIVNLVRGGESVE